MNDSKTNRWNFTSNSGLRLAFRASAVCLALAVPWGVSAQNGAGADSTSSAEAGEGDASGEGGANTPQEDLAPVVISATRTATPISEITRSVTTVSGEELQAQIELDTNLGSVLAQTVPGMGPSTEAVSNFGQSLRGRNFLVLIDGIPQSTPLRDGFRDLNTIDPAAIERIEVVRGGTAVYGFGAAGGLVNIITKEPSPDKVAGHSSAGVSASTEEFHDSGEYRTTHRISGTSGGWDYLASLAYTEKDGRFDSKGRRIPPDPLGTQGGLSDTSQWNVLGKLGYEFDAGDQRLDLMVNYFDVAQDTDFIFGSPSSLGFDPTPDSRRTPAVPISEAQPGSANVKDPGTENFAANLNYSHRNWMGGSLDVNAYYGDQTAVFSKFPGFPQSEITSEKYGSRLTADTPFEMLGQSASLVWGVDLLRDETAQDVFGGGFGSDADTIELEQGAVAGFAELEMDLGGFGLLRGGVRHEAIDVEADTVEANRFGNTVLGGDLDFDETLFNVSGVFYLSETTEIFGGFSQGFSLSDLGRSIGDAGPAGGGGTFQAEDFETEAEVVDQFEVGLRRTRGDFQYTVAAFYSESDNGTTFDQNLAIQKFSEEIYGVEASADYRFNEQWQVGGTFSFSEGERESDGAEEDLPNTRISPEKITAHVLYTPFSWWSNRLQAQYVGDRNPDSNAFGSGDVDGYLLVDWVGKFEIGPGELTLSVENLLNRDYFPAVNQAFNSPFAFAKGPGRRIGVSYGISW